MVAVPRSAAISVASRSSSVLAVDFLAEADDVFDALREVLAGARDGLLHALKERGLFFCTAK